MLLEAGSTKQCGLQHSAETEDVNGKVFMLPRAHRRVKASAWKWLPCCFSFSSRETAAVTVSDSEILQPRPVRATLEMGRVDLERPQPWLASDFQAGMHSELRREVES